MSSPLVRAHETLERSGLQESAIISHDLLEWDNGDYEGISTVSTLGFERENRVIRHWNEGCHLRSIEATP